MRKTLSYVWPTFPNPEASSLSECERLLVGRGRGRIVTRYGLGCLTKRVYLLNEVYVPCENILPKRT